MKKDTLIEQEEDQSSEEDYESWRLQMLSIGTDISLQEELPLDLG